MRTDPAHVHGESPGKPRSLAKRMRGLARCSKCKLYLPTTADPATWRFYVAYCSYFDAAQSKVEARSLDPLRFCYIHLTHHLGERCPVCHIGGKGKPLPPIPGTHGDNVGDDQAGKDVDH